MCGIVGARVLHGDGRITVPYLERMRDAMVHRGPDGAGTWIAPDGKLGLGHRRLSIIDLSSAAGQPMGNRAGTLWITFNGEIYNHAEIRRTLIEQGHHEWQTDHSDTEVILKAYEAWGIDCLHRLRGMFAFALWDGRDQTLWLVRDRIGIKPLYYSVHHERITFASEIKALLNDPDQPKAIDETALFDYLSFLTTPAPRTLFAGIRKVPAGTWIRVSADGSIREQRYWDVLDHVQPLREQSEAAIAEGLLAELQTAVTLHKASDVPVGVFLSGGIDSSTNAVLFSEGGREPVQTFTIGYGSDFPGLTDEVPAAREMADRIGAKGHVRILTADDLLQALPELVYLQDEPLADPTCVPTYFVASLARQSGVSVCQVGEGADELFWGYPNWQRPYDLARWNAWPLPTGLKSLGLLALQATGGGQSWPYEWLRRGASGEPVFWSGAEAFPESAKRRLVSSQVRKRLADYSSWEAIKGHYERFRANAWEQDASAWMTYADLTLRLPELLLMRLDKMGMGSSLEGRVPFLDHQVVTYAMGIPAAIKTAPGDFKRILKRAVGGLLPEHVLQRPKQGFGVPLDVWYRDHLGDVSRREITAFCDATGLLDKAEVARMLERGNGRQIWNLLILALWWRRYF